MDNQLREQPKAAVHFTVQEVGNGFVVHQGPVSLQATAPAMVFVDSQSLAAHLQNLLASSSLSTELDEPEGSFQSRVQPWMLRCFGAGIAADGLERNHRFLEEALELVQANGCTRFEAIQLVDYVFARPTGDLEQEVGGVMVTLAALCLAAGADMQQAAEAELDRVWTLVDQIRARQMTKPRHSPLPQHVAAGITQADPGLSQAVWDVLAERRRQQETDGWSPAQEDRHTRGEMAAAAASLAVAGNDGNDLDSTGELSKWLWPWDPASRHGLSPRQGLVRAAALLLAEIERRDRIEASLITGPAEAERSR